MSPLTVMLVAAEASGDALGADLARALKAKLGDGVRFVGVGGARMAELGVASPFDISQLSILGLVEGLRAWPRVIRLADQTAALARREQPDVAVMIDSWGFSLRVAQRLRRQSPHLPLVKYVAPQVWASRPGRARTLAVTVDLLLSTQPMDAPFFEREGLKTVFVGNPAVAREGTGDGARFRAVHGLGEDAPILLVLPGSRPGEVARMNDALRDAGQRLVAACPGLSVVIPVAETVTDQVRLLAADWPVPVMLVEGAGAKADAINAATAALACSGTVTTELAMAGCPMVVGYRVGALTHIALKRLITTRYITLFNIAAGQEIAREFVQDACTGAALAAAALPLLTDPAVRGAQVAAQTAALDRMGRGGPDPSEQAAEAILQLVRPKLLAVQRLANSRS